MLSLIPQNRAVLGASTRNEVELRTRIQCFANTHWNVRPNRSLRATMFGTSEAISAASALVDLRKDYSNPPKTERGLDPIFYGYITAAHSKVKVSRQVHIKFHGAKKPSRIDFRIGGSNPTVLELAVRPTDGQQQLCGPQNLDELRKLSKVTPSKAKRRILLLVDLKKYPISKASLKATYDPLHAGPGRKPRHAVTVVYFHRQSNFSFTWVPRKA